jgi:beta-lactamase regulating signal transducer with metallopeptidase domain/predicted  nucleic acid-binding Zn-ribbon protein
MSGVLVESALRSLALGTAVGLGMSIFRARSPRLRMAAWTLVLLAALLMPFLMRVRTVEIAAPRRVVDTAPVVVVRAVHVYRSAVMQAPAFSWTSLALRLYLVITALLVLRLLIGLLLAIRLWHRAMPIREPWTRGLAVRESEFIDAPATFGSGIVLPADWPEWDELKRDAVIAHERAHVRWGDFYVQALSRLHVAIFWFSPLAWWLRNRLARLAEAASDDAALENLPDRASYAEILLHFARRPQRPIAAVAMARPRTVSARVDRILSGAALAAKAGWKSYALLAALTICSAALIGGFSVHAQATPPEPPAPPAAPAAPEPAPPQAPQPPAAPDAKHRSNWWWSSDSHDDSWAIVSGDSLSMSGSMDDAERARSYRSSVSGPYIWYLHDGRSYLITDPATVKRAQEFFRGQEELGRKQAELGQQQARLGEQQALLGQQQSGVRVRMPDLDREIAEARAQVQIVEKQLRDSQQLSLARNDEQLKALEEKLKAEKGKDVSQDEINALQERLSDVQSHLSDELSDRISEIQSRIGDLQSQFGELQSRAGEAQSKLGDAQSRLGDEQSKLGEQQSKLGDEQSRLAEEANRQLRKLFDESLHNGVAKPAQ